MEFQRIKDLYLKNVFKILFSTMVLYAPLYVIYGFLYRENSLLLSVFYIFIQACCLEHIYILISKIAKGEEVSWVNKWFSSNTFRVGLIHFLAVFIKINLVPNFAEKVLSMHKGFIVIVFALSFLAHLLVFALYMSIAVLTIDEDKGIFDGIREAFFISKQYIEFHFLATTILLALWTIPYIGSILGAFFYIFIEFIRTFLYLGSVGDYGEYSYGNNDYYSL